MMAELTLEAIRRLLSRAWLTVALVAIVTITILGSALLELVTAGQFSTEHENAVASGADVYIVSSDARDISAKKCNEAILDDGVYRSGAVYSRTPMSATHAPGLTFQLVEVSPSFLSILDSSGRVSTTMVAGHSLARNLGLSNGSYVSLSNGLVNSNTSILEDTLRTQGQGQWMLSVVAGGTTAAECWIEATPSAGLAVRDSLVNRFLESKETKVEVLASFNEESFVERWDDRVSKLVWFSSALTVCGLFSIILWLRRSEYALYSFLGIGKLSRAYILIAELNIILLLSSIIALINVYGISFLMDDYSFQGTMLGVAGVAKAYAVVSLFILILATASSFGDQTRLVRGRD